MIRRRTKPDGLPYRVYERKGKRTYSIGYKMDNSRWAFRYSCDIQDHQKVLELKRLAVTKANQMQFSQPIGGTTSLIEAWFEWQDTLPVNSGQRRADSTLAENKRESKNLKDAFGHLEPNDITKADGYAYLDACASANRAAKGNKEVALLQVILEFGIRIGKLNINPLAGIRKNVIKTTIPKRYVTDVEIDLALKIGRLKGGSRLIVALALRTAWLCVRRSVEVRAITMHAITDNGIVWHDGKNKEKAPVMIEWTPDLRETITEALNITRNHVAGSMYLFGNMKGQKYTKGGWKSVLDDLMQECVKYATENQIAFKPFSLQDCRPKGITDKLTMGHQDVLDATNHTSERMLKKHYDRREMKVAKPVE